MSVTVDDVLGVLRTIEDPDLHRDIVSLGFVQQPEINDGRVSVRIVLTTPACPVRDWMEVEAREKIGALPGVREVDVTMEANVPQHRATGAKPVEGVRHIIAVASNKGGVGKSTVATNLAVALARLGARVGLLDADIYGPNVPTMMGVDRLPPPRDGKMVPAEAFGVKLVSIAFLVKPGQPLIWRGPMLHTAIRQFIADVQWGELDYMIVDLPPGTGDAPLSLSQSLPLTGAVIVTMPQKVSLEDAGRALEMFRTMKVPILGVVENMSVLKLPNGEMLDLFGTGGGQRLATEAQVPFLGSIPIDARVRQGGDQGMPVVISAPDSEVGQALTSIAEKVAARISVQARTQSNLIPIEMID